MQRLLLFRDPGGVGPVLFAQGFGVKGLRVTSCTALSEALVEALPSDLPTLIEVKLPEFTP